ncbi:DUF2695 domain-containing protein [Larkinella insperata]|uniref:DUF2695 domain-containing protein n=1 Tax=Larkinella insperata TaxID=332158 RepID=A0ABW3Q8B8_9BACT
MSPNEEKQRKQLLQHFRQQEKEKKLAQMPMAATDLQDLFDYLNEQLQEEDCDDSLILTEAFLRQKGLPIKQVTNLSSGRYWDLKDGQKSTAVIIPFFTAPSSLCRNEDH